MRELYASADDAGGALFAERRSPYLRQDFAGLAAGGLLLSCSGGQWEIPYGEAVCRAAADEKIRFIGHNCLHQTNQVMQIPLMQLVWHQNIEKES